MDPLLLIKALLLTDVTVRALRSWGIFDRLRSQIKARSQFVNKLLSCYECTSVWSAAFVVVYLLYFEVPIITYWLMASRLATWLNTAYEWLDAVRAVKEGEI
jgi:hypothetical protein